MVSTRSTVARKPLATLSAVANRSHSIATKASVAKRSVKPAAKASSKLPMPPSKLPMPPLGTLTKSNWCLRKGLDHVIAADANLEASWKSANGPRISLKSLIDVYGPPPVYKCMTSHAHCKGDDGTNHPILSSEPTTCFQSLCRIVTGQQLAVNAARAIWERLLVATEYDLTPERILQSDMELIRASAGLSGAKARSIRALAEAFEAGDLSEQALLGGATAADDSDIRKILLGVWGIGNWSVDMFLMFSLEHSNVLPLGDLGVRKGLSVYFGVPLDAILDKRKKGGSERLLTLVEPYKPYSSLLSYYMWKTAGVPAPNQTKANKE